MQLYLDSAISLHGMHWDIRAFEQSKDGAILCADTYTLVARQNAFYICSQKSVTVGLRLVQTYLEFLNK